MTNIQAIELLKGLEQSLDDYCELNDEGKAAFRMAITALEQFGNSEPLPSAQPDLDEWCTDCKEYDSEKHHCPRYNRVIREALKGAEPRKPGKWEFIGDNMFECTSCGVVYTTEQLNGLRNYDTDPYAPKFCPNCGADMRGG